ncbi:hypothetical protein JCM10450v2_005805 [Rhodotorula kratochvilovae]
MPPALPSLKRIHRQATRDGTVDAHSGKKLRQRLKDVEGWSCDDTDWKAGGLRDEVVRRWEELINASDNDEQDASPPPAKKRKQAPAKKDNGGGAEDEQKPKSKYDRATEKNLKTFVGAVVGDVLGAMAGGGGEDDFDDADDDEAGSSTAFSASPSPVDNDKPEPKAKAKKRAASPAFSPTPDEGSPVASGSGSGSPAPQKEKKKAAKRASDASAGGEKKTKKAGVRAPKTGFKSAEFIADSDDSSAEVAPARRSGDEDAGKGKGKGGNRKDRGGAAGKGKEKAKEGKAKEKAKEGKAKKERKASEPKPGDAPKGVDEEEERIKKLKELLSAASGPRAFTAATGAERTLTVDRRTEILEGLLKTLGLPVKNGKLPSMGKAKEVGEKRALAKEMQDLSGNPLQSGLRDGKRPHGDTSDSDDTAADAGELPSVAARKRQVVEQRKSFGAFLGDQSSDSD